MVILYLFGAVLGLLSRRRPASIPLSVALIAMPPVGMVLQFFFC
jgi:hypothetical protein